MSKQILGKVCVTPKGEWDNTLMYDVLDIVTYEGSSYLAKQTVETGIDIDNTDYWLLIAEKGEKGDKGDKGNNGTNATITGASATVDASSGTPSVDVTSGGTASDRSFAFAFHNLRGTSITSIEKTSTSGLVDTYTITLSDGTTTTFAVTNGADGDTTVIAPQYSASSTYSKGEYVLYEGDLYIALRNISTAEAWTSAHWQAVTVGEQLKKLEDNKANKKGYYDEMGVGTADNLTTNLIETNGYPFNFAPTGGLGKVIEAANRVFLRKIIYGSVVVNQLIDPLTSSIDIGGVTVSATNGKYSISGTATTSGGRNTNISKQTFQLVSGHKYLFTAKWLTDNFQVYIVNNSSTSEYQRVYSSGLVFQASFSANCRLGINVTSGKQYDFSGYINLIDVTKWYGSTETADHIYAMETANANAGVNFFFTQHPQASGYIPNNTGTPCSSKPSFHKTSDLNWWDEETAEGYYNTTTGKFVAESRCLCGKNLNRCEPNTTYYVTSPSSLYIMLYDIDGNFIAPYKQVGSTAGWTFTTPSNAYFFTWWQSKANYGSQTYGHDICFIDHYDDTMNGVYEASNIHTYEFDTTAEGHGIFKFKRVNNVLTDELYVDGDELASDGTLTTKYKPYTLNGDISESDIALTDFSEYGYTRIVYLPYSSEGVANVPFISDRFVFAQNSDPNSVAGECKNSASNPRMYLLVPSTVTTKAEAIAWFASNPTTIYAPIATPTTSQKDAYDEEQACHNWGYEYYNDSEFDAGNRAVQIPVGMVADYPANLKDKVEAYPSLPDEDGSYLLTKNGNNYSYRKFASSIPTIPSTDGTYALKATVSSGTATLEWVADT